MLGSLWFFLKHIIKKLSKNFTLFCSCLIFQTKLLLFSSHKLHCSVPYLMTEQTFNRPAAYCVESKSRDSPELLSFLYLIMVAESCPCRSFAIQSNFPRPGWRRRTYNITQRSFGRKRHRKPTQWSARKANLSDTPTTCVHVGCSVTLGFIGCSVSFF